MTTTTSEKQQLIRMQILILCEWKRGNQTHGYWDYNMLKKRQVKGVLFSTLVAELALEGEKYYECFRMSP